MRRQARQAEAKPIVEALKPWLESRLAQVSKGSALGAAIRYGLRHWDGLVRYLDDARIEIDSNTVERSIRPIALNRNYAHVRIMRSCRTACAESPVDGPVRDALHASNCA